MIPSAPCVPVNKGQDIHLRAIEDVGHVREGARPMLNRVLRKTGAWVRWSLNFVLLSHCPRTAHNQTVTDRGNVVKNLFVGNLSSEVTHEELRRLFEAYGEVAQVHIIVDRDTGLPRGFAFVEMTNDAEAEKAIRALNGSILRDRTLDVNYARPRPERPAA